MNVFKDLRPYNQLNVLYSQICFTIEWNFDKGKVYIQYFPCRWKVIGGKTKVCCWQVYTDKDDDTFGW